MISLECCVDEFTLSLYRMLSRYYDTPFLETDFKEGDVAWISSTLDQTHVLENKCAETRVTIQCYMYSTHDNQHYEYFGCLEEKDVAKMKYFYLDSDCDCLDFKERRRTSIARRRQR